VQGEYHEVLCSMKKGFHVKKTRNQRHLASQQQVDRKAELDVLILSMRNIAFVKFIDRLFAKVRKSNKDRVTKRIVQTLHFFMDGSFLWLLLLMPLSDQDQSLWGIAAIPELRLPIFAVSTSRHYCTAACFTVSN
jgi:hypothetical protein